MAVKTASIAKKPIVIIMHDEIQRRYLDAFSKIYSKENIHLIYNSFWIKRVYEDMKFNGCVVFPPVYWKDYQVETNRKYVTLINCNANKGGKILIQLAKLMPDIEFLGVEGAYNTQIKDKNIKNITYLPSTPNIESIYEQTDIIIMPSKQETWGRVAIEAISSGIPVIANPTEGLREALDYCGIYVSYTDIKGWVDTIRKLKTDEAYYKKISEVSIKRSRELEPTLQLKAMEEWLQKIK
jgi:glycosyltransferase involved in cell wall biosynthesis